MGLTSLHLDDIDSISADESDAESVDQKADNLIGERLRQLCRREHSDNKDDSLRVSDLLSPTSPQTQTLDRAPNSLRPLLTPSLSTPGSFNKALHLNRLHPLKLQVKKLFPYVVIMVSEAKPTP